MSPGTISTSSGSTPAELSRRVSTRTFLPSATSRRTTAGPMAPVAPLTAMTSLLMCDRDPCEKRLQLIHDALSRVVRECEFAAFCAHFKPAPERHGDERLDRGG